MAHMQDPARNSDSSASSEATANHQLHDPAQSPAASMETDHKSPVHSPSATAEQQDPPLQPQLVPKSDSKSASVANPVPEPKLESTEDVASVADAHTVPAAISAAEAAKTRRARQRKPTFDEQQAAMMEAYAPTRRRASTKAAALLRDQALADLSDSDYIMDDEPVTKRKGKAVQTEAVLEKSPEPEKMDVLLGCTKCRYLKKGCGACRDKPSLERPASLRWKPDAGKEQKVCGCYLLSTIHATFSQPWFNVY